MLSLSKILFFAPALLDTFHFDTFNQKLRNFVVNESDWDEEHRVIQMITQPENEEDLPDYEVILDKELVFTCL